MKKYILPIIILIAFIVLVAYFYFNKFNFNDKIDYNANRLSTEVENNKVTYTENGSTATNGKTNTTAISKYEHPDGRILGSNNITSITVKNTSYEYYPNTLTTNDSETTVGIETTSVVYKLLFRNSTNTENCNYWLASSYVNTDAGSSGFGLRVINSDGKVYYLNLWNSDGVEHNSTMGVRAVVQVD